MKKTIVLACLLSIPILSISQYGYKYHSKYIRLEPDKEAMQYVIAENLNALKSQIIESNSPNKIFPNNIQELSSTQFFIPASNELTKFGTYASYIYKTSEGRRCVVLPKINLSLKDDVPIEDVIKEFHGRLTVYSKHRNHYTLNCIVANANNVLEIVHSIDSMNVTNWCEPDMIPDLREENYIDNTLWSQQYYMSNWGQTGGTYNMDIHITGAWLYTTGSPSVTVAIIDTGVDFNHEDLQNCVLSGYTAGYYYGNGTPQCTNQHSNKGHGIACAGIIAANDNTKGIIGVAHGVKILPVNIFPYYATSDGQGGASSSDIADAIIWASQRADILSCSWSTGSSQVIESAIEEARTEGRDSLGCVVVAASGNNYQYQYQPVAFPARLNGVIAVGALDKNGDICNYSQRGSKMNLVAFGGYHDIVTTDRMGSSGYTNGNYVDNFSGTSAACPQVAGIAALMLSSANYLTEEEVRNTLQSTARDFGATGWDSTYGYGLVNAADALYAVTPQVIDISYIQNNAYRLTNVPARASVLWTYLGQGAQAIEVVNDSPYINSCTLINNTNGYFVGSTLRASMIINGVVVKTVDKVIDVEPNNRTNSLIHIDYDGSNVHISIADSNTDNIETSSYKQLLHIENQNEGCYVDVIHLNSGDYLKKNAVFGNSYHINTTKWSEGTYLIKVKYRGNYYTKKVFVK